MKTKEEEKNYRKASGQINNKKVLIEWSEPAMDAFYQLKDALCGSNVLILPDFNENFFLATESCDYAYGGMLAQMRDNEPTTQKI